MKQLIYFSIFVSLFLMAYSESYLKFDVIKKDVDYFEQLNKFCSGKKFDFCSNEQLKMSIAFLKQKQNQLKEESESKILQEENERQLKLKNLQEFRKNRLKMNQKLREHFLDRYF